MERRQGLCRVCNRIRRQLRPFGASLAAILLASCGIEARSPVGRLEGLSASGGAKNIALVFGAANGLPGIDLDIKTMQGVLGDASGNFNFQVVPKMGATASDILRTVKETAPLVGDGGTLVFYFSGHGGDGLLLAENHTGLQFSKVSDAIKEVRTTPLRRFMVVIDTCNNGGLADSGAIALTSAADGDLQAPADAMADAIVDALGPAPVYGQHAAGLYQELFVITSSTATESSAATDAGSAFTVAFAQAFRELKVKSGFTIRQLAELARSKTKSSGGHTPVFRAVPEALYNEPALNAPGGQQPPATAESMFLALGNPDLAGAAPVAVAAGVNVNRVALCFDAAANCRASRREDLPFDTLPVVRPGVNFFRSRLPLLPPPAGVVTILGFDAQGGIVEARSVKFVAR